MGTCLLPEDGSKEGEGDETSVSVVVSTLPTGVYVATLTVDGKAIYSVKFNKK